MTHEYPPDDGWFGGKIDPALYESCKKWIAENYNKRKWQSSSTPEKWKDSHKAMMERCTKIVQDHENGVR